MNQTLIARNKSSYTLIAPLAEDKFHARAKQYTLSEEHYFRADKIKARAHAFHHRHLNNNFACKRKKAALPR